MFKKYINSVIETTRDRGVRIMLMAVLYSMVSSLEKRVLNRRFIKRRIYDYDMYLDTNDKGLSRSLLLFRNRELDHKYILEEYLKPDMNIFDVGGNIGYYPLMELKLLNNTGSMLIIEPSPENVSLLKKNLNLNGYDSVPIIEAAVSDKLGKREFFLSTFSNLGTFHTEGSGSEKLSGETIDVHTTTISQLAEKYGKPDLMRMDIEGHEVDVFEGMIPDLTKNKYSPVIIFETHFSRYGAAHDMSNVLEKLFSLGYEVPMVASSSEYGTSILLNLGYVAEKYIASDGVNRGIFRNIKPDDFISILCKTGGIRTAVLSK